MRVLHTSRFAPPIANETSYQQTDRCAKFTVLFKWCLIFAAWRGDKILGNGGGIGEREEMRCACCTPHVLHHQLRTERANNKRTGALNSPYYLDGV